MVTRYSLRGTGRRSLLVLLALTFTTTLSTPARAYGPDESPLDLLMLVQMEHRADVAQAADQCFLYAQVLHGLTELAGREMSSGMEEDAAATMKQIDTVAGKARAASSARNVKRLKNAEELMEHTTHRLADMVRVASSEERTVMQATLQRLNGVHDNLLAMVFAH